MATATVTEYSNYTPDRPSYAMRENKKSFAATLNVPYLASELVTFTTTTTGTAFDADTRFVRIAAIDSGLHFELAAAPVATTDSPYLPIGGVVIVGVEPGSGFKVALLAS